MATVRRPGGLDVSLTRRRFVLSAGATAIVGAGAALADVFHVSTRSSQPRRSLADQRFGAFIPQEGAPGAITGVESEIGRHLDLIMGFYSWSTGTSAINRIPPPVLAEAGSRDYVMTVQPSSGRYGAPASRCVQWPGLVSGQYDQQIISLARWINDTIGRTFYVRFAHEMNGSGWYDWQVGGACGVTSGPDYAAGFNRFARVLHDNTDHARLVWAPNHRPAQNIASFYPTECDVVGFDAYNFGTTPANWESSAELFGPAYEAVTSCDPTKPVWVCETACAEPARAWTYENVTYPPDPANSKATWVEAMFKDTSTYPGVSALIWFDVRKERDWTMTSSPGSTQAFYRAFAGSRSGAVSRLGSDGMSGSA